MAKSKWLASVKPWGANPVRIMYLARYRHIWRVYRAAVAFHDADIAINLRERGSVSEFAEAQDELYAAIEAARKAGVK